MAAGDVYHGIDGLELLLHFRQPPEPDGTVNPRDLTLGTIEIRIRQPRGGRLLLTNADPAVVFQGDPADGNVLVTLSAEQLPDPGPYHVQGWHLNGAGEYPSNRINFTLHESIARP